MERNLVTGDAQTKWSLKHRNKLKDILWEVLELKKLASKYWIDWSTSESITKTCPNPPIIFLFSFLCENFSSFVSEIARYISYA